MAAPPIADTLPPEKSKSSEVLLIVGLQVEYNSMTHGQWMPALIISVHPETGTCRVNISPERDIYVNEHHNFLRPVSKPRLEQVQIGQLILRDGKIEEETEKLFRLSAISKIMDGSDKQEECLRGKEIRDFCRRIDEMLGINGSILFVSKEMKKVAVPEGVEHVLTFDGAAAVLWSSLKRMQEDHAHALPTKKALAGSSAEFNVQFDVRETLGEGTYGVVKRAVHKKSGSQRAIKTISKKKIYGSMDSLKKEIDNLSALDHPNIVRLYAYYEDVDSFQLVMDFCSAGDLSGCLRRFQRAQRRVPENFILDVMWQITYAINHVHNRMILHLDLKPANIMLMPSQRTISPTRRQTAGGGEDAMLSDVAPHVMVIDLGVAEHFKPGKHIHNMPCGTPATMAPEVWYGEFTPKADVFSMGCILYEMYCGRIPFHMPYIDTAAARQFWARRPEPTWEAHLPPEAVMLMMNMLFPDRSGRPCARQVLEAPLLQRGRDLGMRRLASRLDSSKGPASAPNDLKTVFAAMPERSVLYKSIAFKIAKAWPSNQNPPILSLFIQWDKNENGCFAVTNFIDDLTAEMGFAPAQAQKIAEAINLSRDGWITWTEFVAASINLGASEFQETLSVIFREAAEKNGLLSKEGIVQMLPEQSTFREEVAIDLLQEMTGRREAGTRVDLDTFLKHFKVGGSRGSGGDAADSLLKWTFFDSSSGSTDLLTRVGQLWGSLWQESGALTAPADMTPVEKQQFCLNHLYDMGFKDRDRNLEVMAKFGGGTVTPSVIEELTRRAS